MRRIRDHGFQNAVLSTDPEQQDEAKLLAQAQAAPGLDGRDLVAEVTTTEPYEWQGGAWPGIEGQLPRPGVPSPRLRLVAYDFGIKRNILRLLDDQGFDVTVVPAQTSADAVRALSPDAVFLSNGPGDPAAVVGVQDNVRALSQDYPMFGICLGHQILGLALGGSHPQAQVRAPRGQPAREGSGHGEGRHLRREPRLRRGSRLAGSGGRARRDHPQEPERRNRRGAGGTWSARSSRCSTTRRLRPVPTTARYFFGRFREMVLRHKAGEAVSGAAVAGVA